VVGQETAIPRKINKCIPNVDQVFLVSYVLILDLLSNHKFLKFTYFIIKKIKLILKHVINCKQCELHLKYKDFSVKKKKYKDFFSYPGARRVSRPQREGT
jgi:hypothetical protein